jgi:hypothetical protein
VICWALELELAILFLRPVETALIDRHDGEAERDQDQDREPELA